MLVVCPLPATDAGVWLLSGSSSCVPARIPPCCCVSACLSRAHPWGLQRGLEPPEGVSGPGPAAAPLSRCLSSSISARECGCVARVDSGSSGLRPRC